MQLSRPGFELVVTVSISHNDNHYTTGTLLFMFDLIWFDLIAY